MDNGLTDLSSIYLPRFVSQIVPWGGGQVAVVLIKAGERGGGGRGGKIPGVRTGLGARNLDKTSGHCATVKRVGAP